MEAMVIVKTAVNVLAKFLAQAMTKVPFIIN